MKTLNENQKWSASLGAYLQENEVSNPRPKIGDDDGISNKAMNAVLVLFMLLTVGISIVAAAAPTEEVKYRILLRQAMLDIDRMDYDEAIVKLLEVRTNTEENANVNHLLGVCYLNSGKSYEKAVFYLNRALSDVSADYEEWVLEETRAPLEVMYLLAKAYEKTEQFDMAADMYAQFLASLQTGKLNPSSKTYALISKSAENCRIAAVQQGIIVDNNIVLNK
jgi:tetratricopeptide (TPR) repeat protein